MMNARSCRQRFPVLNRQSVAALLLGASFGLMMQSALAEPVKKPIKAASKHVLKHHVEPGSKVGQMAAGFHPADAALSPAQMAVAERIEQGTVACELGASVTVTADAASPGYFDVHANKFKFHMAPVLTSTGAIRLEDAREGAVWLQLPNKSMLMSQKLGSRLADACVTPAQALVAVALEKNPPPSLLDTPAAAAQPAPSVSVSVLPRRGDLE